jgi:hypothetical protein
VVTRTELYRLEKGHAEEGTPIGSVAKGPRSTQALHVAGWPGPFRQAVYLIEINGGW